MNHLNPWTTGAALALTAAVLSVSCTVAVYLFPDATLRFVNSWMHGLDLTVLRSDRPWTLIGLASGLLNVVVFAFLLGALYAVCHNLVTCCANRCKTR